MFYKLSRYFRFVKNLTSCFSETPGHQGKSSVCLFYAIYVKPYSIQKWLYFYNLNYSFSTFKEGQVSLLLLSSTSTFVINNEFQTKHMEGTLC